MYEYEYFLEKEKNICRVIFLSFYKTREKCIKCNSNLQIKEKKNYKTPIKLLINNRYEWDIFISVNVFRCANNSCKKVIISNPIFNKFKEIDYEYFFKLISEIFKFEIQKIELRDDVYSFM